VAGKIRAALPASSSRQPAISPSFFSSAVVSHPRSSNLRLKKHFTEADQDRFLEESYEFIAKFFENSLSELQERNPGVETRFRRVDAQTFTAVVYRYGKAKSTCAIHLGGRREFGSGITFSYDESSRGNSHNEAMNVEVGEQSISLKPMGMHSFRHSSEDAHLTAEGAAEHFWSMLIEPLQYG
jgi:hypothetical protein